MLSDIDEIDYTMPERGRAALLTISAQRDYCQSRAPVHTAGAGRVLASMVPLVKTFRQQGAPIIHSVRLYRPDGSNVDLCRRRAVEEGLRILMPGTLGAELVDEVKPSPDIRLDHAALLSGELQVIGSKEWVMYRPRWGAFHGTQLEAHLRALDVTTLVICGCNFTTGARATIYEASARDFRIVLVPDAVTGVCDRGIAEVSRMGVYLMNRDNCLGWMRPKPLAAA